MTLNQIIAMMNSLFRKNEAIYFIIASLTLHW